MGCPACGSIMVNKGLDKQGRKKLACKVCKTKVQLDMHPPEDEIPDIEKLEDFDEDEFDDEDEDEEEEEE